MRIEVIETQQLIVPRSQNTSADRGARLPTSATVQIVSQRERAASAAGLGKGSEIRALSALLSPSPESLDGALGRDQFRSRGQKGRDMSDQEMAKHTTRKSITLTAGAGNLGLALLAGRALPSGSSVAASFVVGFICYGLSIVLDVYALRYIGAAREAAFFATAPFAGALVAIPLLHEPVTGNEVAGGLVMAMGIALMVRARARALDVRS